MFMIMPELMIEAQDLRRNFSSKEAVAGISFTTRRGEIFGLLGPNGAGKTTTIRMLTGQIDPSSGSAVPAGCMGCRKAGWMRCSTWSGYATVLKTRFVRFLMG